MNAYVRAVLEMELQSATDRVERYERFVYDTKAELSDQERTLKKCRAKRAALEHALTEEEA